MPKRHYLLVCMVLLVAGCSLAPPYKRPVVSMPATWSTGSSPAGTQREAMRWRSFFSDPQLQQLIELALQQNAQYGRSILDVASTREQYRIQRAALLPTIDATLNNTRQRVSAPLQTPGSPAVVEQYSAGFGITAFELDFFGKLRNLKEAALATYLATEEAQLTARINLIAEVANAYLNILADEELLQLTRDTLKTRERSAVLVQMRQRSGTASRVDVSAAESLRADAAATLAEFKRKKAEDESALALLIGQPLPRWLLPLGTLDGSAVVANLPSGLPSDLLTHRPDIRGIERQLQAANANIGVARAAFFPSIELTASLGVANTQLHNLFNSGTKVWSFMPSLNLPIFDGGNNRARLEVAKIAEQKVVLQYVQTIRTAFKEVDDALIARASFSDQLAENRLKAKAEEERFTLSKLRYEAGVDDFLSLLDAEREVFTVKQQVIQTQAAQLANLVSLYKVLGGGVD